jgi:hypothetical protein
MVPEGEPPLSRTAALFAYYECLILLACSLTTRALPLSIFFGARYAVCAHKRASAACARTLVRVFCVHGTCVCVHLHTII